MQTNLYSWQMSQVFDQAKCKFRRQSLVNVVRFLEGY